MTDATTLYDPVATANALEISLLAGKGFTLPALDLSGTAFQAPGQDGNPLYADVTQLGEIDLTDRSIGGNGLFDAMMASLGAHLLGEYKAGRITGNEYTKAYTELMAVALGQSVQFLLARDQAYWQAQLIQKQARAAEVAAVQARVELETAKANAALARVQTASAEIEYGTNKLRLASEDVAYALAQKSFDKAAYELANLMPAQLAMANAQKDQVAAQTSQMAYELANILPAQLGKLQKEIQISDYTVTYMLPMQVNQIQKAIDAQSAQIGLTSAQKDQVLYQTASILPAQAINVQKDSAIKDYTLSAVLPAQVSGVVADTAGKVYSNTYLLPAQLNAAKEQAEAQRAQTLDTRSDGVTPVTGLLGQQKDLYVQQVESYKRSDEAKIGKMLLDTWVTQKSIDEGLPAPTSLQDAAINTVMSKIRTNINMA